MHRRAQPVGGQLERRGGACQVRAPELEIRLPRAGVALLVLPGGEVPVLDRRQRTPRRDAQAERFIHRRELGQQDPERLPVEQEVVRGSDQHRLVVLGPQEREAYRWCRLDIERSAQHRSDRFALELDIGQRRSAQVDLRHVYHRRRVDQLNGVPGAQRKGGACHLIPTCDVGHRCGEQVGAHRTPLDPDRADAEVRRIAWMQLFEEPHALLEHREGERVFSDPLLPHQPLEECAFLGRESREAFGHISHLYAPPRPPVRPAGRLAPRPRATAQRRRRRRAPHGGSG